MINIKENVIDNEKLEVIRFVMREYVECGYVKIIEDNNDGSFSVMYNEEVVTITFNLTSSVAKYVYDINGEGPYTNDNYKQIRSDIMNYIDYDLDTNNNLEELLIIKEHNI